VVGRADGSLGAELSMAVCQVICTGMPTSIHTACFDDIIETPQRVVRIGINESGNVLQSSASR